MIGMSAAVPTLSHRYLLINVKSKGYSTFFFQKQRLKIELFKAVFKFPIVIVILAVVPNIVSLTRIV